MLRPELPIYDSLVQHFYFLPDAPRKKTSEENVACPMKSYEFLRAGHRRILDRGLLAPAMVQFRETIKLSQHYTDAKVIDTLIWKFSDFLKDAAILKGNVQHA